MRLKKAACFAAVVVIALTLIQYKLLDGHLSGYDRAGSIVFYLLFPGNLVGLLITGGHGGTRIEDAVAPIVGAVTNAIVYSLLFYMASRLRKIFKRPNESIPG